MANLFISSTNIGLMRSQYPANRQVGKREEDLRKQCRSRIEAYGDLFVRYEVLGTVAFVTGSKVIEEAYSTFQ